ncbi:hypothetical protein BGZ76_010498 [Entomortierella beljakovae]|nr:hypothetical protein BGZ76_010498 [Entomortierella beljakovae]
MAAYGGKVGAGSICAMLQSIGVLGLGVVGKTSTCAVGAGLGGLGGYGIGVHTESKEDTESEKDTGFNPNYGSTGTPTSIPRVEGGSKGKGVSRRQKRDPKRPKSKRRTECPPPDESSGALDNMMRVKGISNDDVSENIRRGKAKQAETNEDSGLLGGYTEEEYDSYDSESSDDTGNNNMSSTKKIRVKIEYEHDFNPRLDEVVVVK